MIISSIVSKYLCEKNSSTFALFVEYSGRGFLDAKPFYCDSLDLVSLAIEVGDFFGVTHSGLEEHFLRYRDLSSWVAIVEDSLQHYSATITFQTSGTTGEPKKVEHHITDLLQEAKALASLFWERKSVDAFVRPHHIYGFLYSIVLPKFLDLECKYYEPLPSKHIFTKRENSLVIATPTLYKNLSLLEGSFAADTILVSSSEALAQEDYTFLQKRGAKSIYEFYGSSESLGVGYKTDPKDPYTLFEHLDQQTLKEVQDSLHFIDTKHFYLQERKDERIKHRGYKLHLQSYEQELNALPSIKQAKVSLAKGSLICFINSTSKETTMEEIAQNLEIKPDEIVWMGF